MSIKKLVLAGALGLAALTLAGCTEYGVYDTAGPYYGSSPYYGSYAYYGPAPLVYGYGYHGDHRRYRRDYRHDGRYRDGHHHDSGHRFHRTAEVDRGRPVRRTTTVTTTTPQQPPARHHWRQR